MHLGKVLNFSSFINEAESAGMTKIVILSGTKKPSKTAKSFISECQEKGIECYAVDVNSIRIDNLYNGHLLIDDANQREIIINPEDTAIIPRRGVISNSYTRDVLRSLEEARYFCLNSLESIDVCENKYLTSKVMEKHELPVPKYALVPDEGQIDQAIEEIGGNFPIVMKLLSGSQGIGVSLVDSYASLKSVYQTIKKLNPESEILIQEKIDSDFDVRIQVMVKKFDPLYGGTDNCIILGSMKRGAVEKDFRTNYSLGGTVEEFQLDDNLIDIACKAANAVGCHWCGVDIMIDKNSGNPYILEVNASPGTDGISKAIGKPIVGDVISFVVDRKNWTFSKMEVGYLETIEIPGIGFMVAKFDTGNGSLSCTIQADTMEINGEKLIWTLGDLEFTNDIVDYSSAEIGRDKIERPVIELDVILNGIEKKSVRVSPVDRTQKSTPFLVNRTLMRDLGVMVNPYKAFVVSDSPVTGYSPKKSKGEQHGGIKFK